MNKMPKKPKKVVVYDPNWINPYGIELSGVIAECGFPVDLWCTTNRKLTPRGVRVVPRLALGRSGNEGLVSIAVRRLLSPLAVLGASPWRSPLIVVWTRDSWDALLFTIRGALGGKTIFVYHNPSNIRHRGGFAGWMERRLVRASDFSVVHSSRLAEACAGAARNIRIASHPPYKETTSRAAGATARKLRNAGDKPIVAFVGGLRHDKGASDLVAIAEATSASWILRVLGPDRVSSSTTALLKENGVTCEYVGAATGPSDDELISGLETADVMIAPYHSVTESGSIHMALSLNVPILAYRSPGVEHIVSARSMASNAHEFGLALSRYFSGPWPTHRPEAASLHRRCIDDWKMILNESN